MMQSRPVIRIAVICPLLLAGFTKLGCVDCLIFADRIDVVSVAGRLDVSEPGVNVAQAAVGGELLTDGEVTMSLSPMNDRLAGADGSFTLVFIKGFTPACRTLFGPPLPPPEIPVPDAVRVIVIHDGCEERFLFDVNEESFVDPTAIQADDVLELNEPILLPPCEE